MSNIKAKDNKAVANYDYGDLSGTGYEEVTNDDLVIPFLNVLQANSPQVEDLDNAKAGMFYNTTTQELLDGDKGFVFQPIYNTKAFVEWVPRDKGGNGAPVTQYDPDSNEVKEAIAANGGSKYGGLSIGENSLIETHYVYGFVLDEKGKEIKDFVVLSFSSTKIGPKNKWIQALRTVGKGIPLCANRTIIKSIKQKNEKGSFYNVTFTPLTNTWRESLINPASEGYLLEEARKSIELLTAGKAKADYANQNASTGGDAATEGDGNAPF